MTRVAAVIPTALRPELLDRCLRGLALSRRELVEVVVVHSGDGPTVEAVNRWRDALPLREFVGRRRGASARRNEGWRSCDADVVVFTDDDCEPAAEWVAAFALCFDDPAVDVAQGSVSPHPEDASIDGPFARTVTVDGPGSLYVGANMAVRRTALVRVRGFDEAMSGGEDTDLAWRVISTAAETSRASAWCAEARVWHAVRAVSFRQHLRSLPRWSALPIVVRRHPQLRRKLVGRVFWKREHVTALPALLGLVAAPLDSRALIFTVPHLWRRVRAHGAYAGVELAVSDVFECVVLLAGSVRHRSVLL